MSARRAGVVARGGDRIQAELRHQARPNVVIVEVAADAELGYLNFVRSKDFAGTANGVVFRMIEVVNVVDVGADFGSEKRGIEGGRLGASVAIEPGPVGKGKGNLFAGSGCCGRRIVGRGYGRL